MLEKKEYMDIGRGIIKASKDLLDQGDYNLFILFTDDETIKDINKEYRQIDEGTDVLSFPQIDFKRGEELMDNAFKDPLTGRLLLGDIVVSIDRAKEQAKEYGHSLERELAFLICHGFLHLLAYGHEEKEEEEKMLEKTYEVLEKAGYGRKNV